MLELEGKLTLDLEAIKSPNLCDRFSKEDLDRIGNWVWEGFDRDKKSRYKWEERTEAAMDLAMQVQRAKTFPWPDCANIAFPLVTISAMQFHARAYPAILSGTEIVKYRVVGGDPSGQERQRAERIGAHMSWQRLEEDQAWEPQHDRALLNLSIVGTIFKKSYPDTSKGYNCSDLVLAKDLVLNYFAKSVEECPWKTHIIYLFRNDVYERVQRGIFRDILDEDWYKVAPQVQTSTQQVGVDNRQGTTPPVTSDETTPRTFLEQHCVLDLDDDGYAEPYIITIEENSKACVRIVTRFDREEDIERRANGKVIKIRALEYFTKYPFIPSPDGGIYDVGFGVLLGPLNESVNSLINQLIDAGTMSIAAGGFLGRGAKIRGGVYSFAPFDWKRVDSTGDDLRKNIFPLPVREPSMVLFQLLSLLVNYVNRVSGATDMLVGENPGQNTPASTSQEMVTQGMKIYSGIFKRIWHSMKEEFRKLYILNAMYLPPTVTFGEKDTKVSRQDYLGDPTRIAPAADPSIVSEEIRLKKALTIKQIAMTTNGYNLEEVERRVLKAMDVDGIETLYPGPGKVPPLPNPKVQVEQMKQQAKEAELKFRQFEFMTTLQEEKRMNDEAIRKTEAEIAEILTSIGAEQAKHELEKFKGHVEMLKSRNDLIGKQMELMKQQVAMGQSEQAHRQELQHSEDKHVQSVRHAEEKHELSKQESTVDG